MTEKEPVLFEVQKSVGIITLNRPDKFNSISRALIDGMEKAIRALEADDSVKVLLLNGNGKVFCSGADLDEVRAARQSRSEISAFISRIHKVLRILEESNLPVVGAVHGLALAGGFEIMLACDVVFGGSGTRVGDQHAQYGLVPGGGGSQRLPRLVGLRRALDLMYTNRWLDAAEARDWGLFNYVVPDAELFEKSFIYCQDLAGKSRDGLTAMKRFSRDGLELNLDSGLTLEEESVVDTLLMEDVEEGLNAFLGRRTPNFR